MPSIPDPSAIAESLMADDSSAVSCDTGSASATAAMDAQPEPILEVENLTHTVTSGQHTLTILNQVSLRLFAAETLSVVGQSGSGKSTLLGLLAGLDQATSGRISLLGQPLTDLNEDQRAQLRASGVGFIFQSFQLLPGFTALENVMLPLDIAANPRAKEEAEQLLTQVGLGQRLTHYPSQLSGGEQQRVAIARAFASRPRILFADEPTGNLDPKTGAAIIDLMFDLNQRLGTTLVLVTHDAQLARRCQRRLTMVEGQLHED